LFIESYVITLRIVLSGHNLFALFCIFLGFLDERAFIFLSRGYFINTNYNLFIGHLLHCFVQIILSEIEFLSRQFHGFLCYTSARIRNIVSSQSIFYIERSSYSSHDSLVYFSSSPDKDKTNKTRGTFLLFGHNDIPIYPI
jgi:hypothetical protein